MPEEIKLGPKPQTHRDPFKIFDAAVRIYEMGQYAAEEAYDLACELWDRAHGVFVEDGE